jgi:hypothetical protein
MEFRWARPKSTPARFLPAETREQLLATTKLREVVAADRKAFGPVSAETLRQAEQEW